MSDTRDMALQERLDNVNDAYRLFRCRTILNCADLCPKGLSPAAAISQLRSMLVARAI
jgi:succinate dehydrogenase / fumarate reductase iron-sulfur subunit